jgi:hypothetical protein
LGFGVGAVSTLTAVAGAPMEVKNSSSSGTPLKVRVTLITADPFV